MSSAQIAKRTKATRTDVDAALSGARSDLAKAATMRYEFLDLVQAATVADFDDDPDTVKALVAAASTGQFEHAAQRARDERERTQRRQAFAAELGERGITVLGADADATPLHRLTDAEGTNLTDTDHAQCRGHTRIARSYGYDSGSTKPKLADMNEDDAEAARAQRRDVIESNKAWRAAEPVRREWLRGLLARKTPPKGSAALVAAALACDADTVTRIGGNHRAAELLGCEDTSYGRNSALAVLIDRASEPRARPLGLAVVLARYEDATHTCSWRHVDPATRGYLTYLAERGYTPADVERRACGQDPLPET